VTYQTDTTTLARALVAGIAAGGLIGAAWGLWIDAGLGPRSPYDWSFWFALLLGFGVAESVSWAANRKRGVKLELIALRCALRGVGRLARCVRREAPMQVGDVLAWERTFSEEDVRLFGRLSGDEGVHHVAADEQGRLMVQGLLTATLPTKIGGDLNVIAREM